MHCFSRWNIVLGLACLSLGFVPTLSSQPAGKAKQEEVKAQIIAKLHLTPQQQDALENNKKDHRSKTRDLLKNLRDSMKALRDELQKPAIDRPRIDAIHAEIKGTTNALADLRLEGILKIREVLTPDQHRTMLDEFQKALPPSPPVPDDQDPLLEDPGL